MASGSRHAETTPQVSETASGNKHPVTTPELSYESKAGGQQDYSKVGLDYQSR
jgi:hypothetical protein